MQTRLVAVAVSKVLAGGENKPIEEVDEYVLYTFGWPETLIVLEQQIISSLSNVSVACSQL